MNYALLLYADTGAAEATTPEEAMAELARYGRLTEELAQEGVLRGGEAFLPAAAATTVEIGDSGPIIGTVVPTQRELSGFYLVECSEEHAHAIAAQMPVAAHGHVEVRPLLELPDA